MKKALFDSARFARNLEHDFSQMWWIFLWDRAPTQIRELEVWRQAGCPQDI